MSRFIIQLTANSLIRVNEKPFFVKEENKSIVLELPGAVVAVFDNFVSHAGLLIPNGLIINVELETDDIDKAITIAQNVSTYVMSILSCSATASISQPKPVWAYDASPGMNHREYRRFVYDPSLHMNTRKLDQPILFEILEKKFNKFMQRMEIDSERKERLGRAITSFRRGLSDNDDVLTEFLIHWSSLETLDVVYREVFNLPSQKIYVTCGKCGKVYCDCPECGRSDVFLKTQTLSGVEDVFKILNQPEKFHELRRLRHGIAHGFERLSRSIEIARRDIELVRKTVLLMIMRILDVNDKTQKKMMEQTTFKGKFFPHYKIIGSGTFTPGNVRDLHGHPSVEAQCSQIGASVKGDKLILRPSWSFTPRNCAMTFRGSEVYGEEGTNLEVEMTEPPAVLKGG